MADEPRIVSVQVGLEREFPPVEPGGEPWRSAIIKTRVEGAVWAGRLGLTGDAQADQRNHGGADQAINVYPSEHFAVWRLTPGLAGMQGGAFGENFTTLGADEHSTCLGDLLRVGEALLEVSQPRGPCYKLNRRWNTPDLQRRAEDELRFGWYMRVREEGRVQAGDRLELLERPLPGWTIARVWQVTKGPLEPPAERAAAQELLGLAALGQNWRRSLAKKLSG